MAYAYCVMILGVICFQITLIFGAPWGRLSQGGQTEGPLPTSGRIVSAVSIFILAGMALAMLSAKGGWPNWPSWTTWAAITANTVIMVLNWITPSKAERKLWGPLTTIMLILAIAARWS